MKILILEDNADRRTAMLAQIADCLPMFGVSFFETSDRMIAALRSTDWSEIAMVSLDNDLDQILIDGQSVDAGDGIAVAEFLVSEHAAGVASNSARPPVVLHTTNELAASRMRQTFEDVRWPVERVTPYDGESWIGEVWIRKVRAAIIGNVSDHRSVALIR